MGLPRESQTEVFPLDAGPLANPGKHKPQVYAAVGLHEIPGSSAFLDMRLIPYGLYAVLGLRSTRRS